MKIALITNMVSHHQVPLAENIIQQVGVENFRYIATGDVSEERLRMGWGEELCKSWIIKLNNIDNYHECIQWMNDADVILSGELIFDIFEKRLNRGLLTFYMSERWWKPNIGIFRLINFSHLVRSIKYRNLTKNKKFGYLSIGGYAAKDISMISVAERKIWKWGYFTDNSRVVDLPRESKCISILWAGRIISWKRLDLLVEAVANLIKYGFFVKLSIIGDGVQKKYIQKLVQKKLPEDVCSFLPSMPAAKVFEEMCRSDIFVLSSNGYEGWGAVVNEAMSAGCVVIASDAAGAAVSMIQNGKNGFLFKSGDIADLSNTLKLLCNDVKLRKKISAAAIKTIDDVWSPRVAAQRLISVCRGEISGEKVFYSGGPMEVL